MPDKLDDILEQTRATHNEVRDIHAEVRELKSWLYGADGHTGDILNISKRLDNHSQRIRKIEIIVAGLIVIGGLSGGAFGLVKLLGS